MGRILSRVIGSIFCFFGIIGMLTPIPFGLIFFVIGLLFLIPSTPSAANSVRWARSRFGVFDRSLASITRRLPVPYSRILRETEID
jgi:hypothetical protein